MRIDAVVLDAGKKLREIVNALQNRLTFRDNFESRRVDIPDSGPADTDLIIAHNLGKIPVGYIANVGAAAIVYDQNRAGWTDSIITIRCSQANTAISLEIF